MVVFLKSDLALLEAAREAAHAASAGRRNRQYHALGRTAAGHVGAHVGETPWDRCCTARIRDLLPCPYAWHVHAQAAHAAAVTRKGHTHTRRQTDDRVMQNHG